MLSNQELSNLVEALQEATKGEVSSFEPGYVEDVKQRIPAIEKTLEELKKYLSSEKGGKNA